jgi:alpha-mannosidase
MKRAEDDDFSKTSEGNIVVRLYEAFGGHARTKVRFGKSPFWKIEKAVVTNLLEDELEELKLIDDGAAVQLDFHGFEVKTIKVSLKRRSKPEWP